MGTMGVGMLGHVSTSFNPSRSSRKFTKALLENNAPRVELAQDLESAKSKNLESDSSDIKTLHGINAFGHSVPAFSMTFMPQTAQNEKEHPGAA